MKIIFLDANPSLCSHWNYHISQLLKCQNLSLSLLQKPVSFHVEQNMLQKVTFPQSNGRTIIVSPGNSLGYMGGGIDRAIGLLFSKTGDVTHAELKIKKYLRRGYSPPQSPRLVQFSKDEIEGTLAWKNLQADCILHLPTMRTPRHLELEKLEAYRFVFDLTWNILETIVIEDGNEVDNILIPGLATGYGGIEDEVAAKSMVAAVSIFCNDSYNDDEKSFLVLKYLQEDPTMYLQADTKVDQFDIFNESLGKLFSKPGTSTQ